MDGFSLLPRSVQYKSKKLVFFENRCKMSIKDITGNTYWGHFL